MCILVRDGNLSTSCVPSCGRQVKMIYKGRLSEEDLEQCTVAIRKNTVECMQGVLRAMDNFGITLGLAGNILSKQVR